MIYFCNSMPKSASSFLNNMEKEAVALRFGRTGQDALAERIKSGDIAGSGNFIGGTYDRSLLAKLDDIARAHGPLVVKAHVAINDALKSFLAADKARMSYVYRRPHDVVLSALDHNSSNPEEFRTFTDIASAVNGVKGFCSTAIRWKSSGMAMILQYEELVADPVRQLDAVVRFFGFELDVPSLSTIVERTRAQQQSKTSWNLRFNKGRPGRYLEEFNAEELKLCDDVLGPFLPELGY